MLSAPLLTDALAEHLGGAAVTAVTVSPIGTGQVSDSYRLTLLYDHAVGLPSSLIAKVPAADPTSRSSAASMGHYRTEVAFYRSVGAISWPPARRAAFTPASMRPAATSSCCSRISRLQSRATR